MSTKLQLLYLVNAHIPNVRANGVQIAHTCEELGKHVQLTLATRLTPGVTEDSATRYHIAPTFRQRYIPCIDIPGMPFRYAVRNTTFFLCANIYALGFFLKHAFLRNRAAMYVRGEVILSLVPLACIFPIFFETHQIRRYIPWYRFALRQARGAVVITESFKQRLIEEFHVSPEKIVIARDAVDLEKFGTLQKDISIWHTYGISTGKKIVLYAGTLSEEKGVHALAEAAQYVAPDVHIVFLGGTDDQLRAFRAQYGHVSNITIVGRVNHIEVPKHLVSADMLVLPDSGRFVYSNLYTSPMKLFEYMACGVPILAANVPSVREVLDQTNAIFFEADNARSCAEQMMYISTHVNESAVLAAQAQSKVRLFTWKKRGEAIIQHIVTCLS